MCWSWNSHIITQQTQKNRKCENDNLCVICRLKKLHSKTLFKLGDILYEDRVKIYKWLIVIARTWHFYNQLRETGQGNII